MLAERRTLEDPLSQCLLLRVGQGAMRVDRRHPLLRVLRENPVDEFALVRLAGNNHAFLPLSLARVQSQPSLARLRVLSMTVIAVLRQDGPHIAAEVDRRGPGVARGEGDEKCDAGRLQGEQ